MSRFAPVRCRGSARADATAARTEGDGDGPSISAVVHAIRVGRAVLVEVILRRPSAINAVVHGCHGIARILWRIAGIWLPRGCDEAAGRALGLVRDLIVEALVDRVRIGRRWVPATQSLIGFAAILAVVDVRHMPARVRIPRRVTRRVRRALRMHPAFGVRRAAEGASGIAKKRGAVIPRGRRPGPWAGARDLRADTVHPELLDGPGLHPRRGSPSRKRESRGAPPFSTETPQTTVTRRWPH